MKKNTLLITFDEKLLEQLKLIAAKKKLDLSAVVEEGLKECASNEIKLLKAQELFEKSKMLNKNEKNKNEKI